MFSAFMVTASAVCVPPCSNFDQHVLAVPEDSVLVFVKAVKREKKEHSSVKASFVMGKTVPLILDQMSHPSHVSVFSGISCSFVHHD